MKKILTVMLVILLLAALFSGCGNYQLIDAQYNFDRAIVKLPNGLVVEGKLDSWCDYDDCDNVQVKIDGTTYYTHAANVVLIAD